jgi:hypothetical protein
VTRKHTQEEFDSLLAVKNPNVIRIDNYINSFTKIKFKCLRHNKIYQASPRHCLKGHGLTCCSSKVVRREKAALEFDSKLSIKNPLIKRVGKYIDSHTKINFKCLRHNQIHQASPRHPLQGRGLKCCSSGRLKGDRAALEFDSKLSIKNPLIKRVGEYIDSRTKIDFKCLRHNQIYQGSPSHCLRGQGLACCAAPKLGSSLKNILKAEKDNQTVFYTYSLSRYKKYVKFGIARRLESRKNLEYGEEIFAKQFNTRLEAFAIEQACLKDSQLAKDCPEELDLNKWPGRTEVRKCSRQTALARANFYVQELKSIGVKEFILKYLNPSPYEKALLKRKSL